MKSITIPHLKLCACVEAIKLDNLIRKALDISLISSTFWSDSEIALAYIKNETRRFKVFVGNRVSVFRRHSELDQWHHVRGELNPADNLSRGCDVISSSDSWIEGPSFYCVRTSGRSSLSI